MFARDSGIFVHEVVLGNAFDGLIWLLCDVLGGAGEDELDLRKRRMRRSRTMPRRMSFRLR